jgi:hypothetical protein
MMLSRYLNYGIPYESRVYILRDMIFNEAELIENMSVGDFPQNITAPTNIITISMLTENKDDEFIATRIRKIIFKIELSKEAVGVTEISSDMICKMKLLFYDLCIYERNGD